MIAIQGFAATQSPHSADFINIIERFEEQPKQIKLIQWFQASTGREKQLQFAMMWRNSDDQGDIDFVNVFRSYRRMPHQTIALEWLAEASHPKTLAGFLNMWHGAIAAELTLLDAIREFRDCPKQVKLVRWLQDSTGEQKQREFALMWRDGQSNAPIDFVQVFRYYQDLPHQNAAINWLQQCSQSDTIRGFLRMWKALPPTSGRLELNVPFYLQTDNLYEPMRTCNTSSCAMVARFLGASIKTDDEYYQIVRRYGDTTDHSAQTKALNQIGIRSTWHTNLNFEQLDQSLEARLPIVIGILHRGSLQAPTGGHMLVVIGRTESKDYICHDPFGSLLDPGGAYTGSPQNGKNVVYPRYVLTHRWMPDGANSGWGRLFYGN